ncbi:retinol dehydrogenase 12 [Fusarium longipes]|uniref:Retinol dehydrogenase 12 n=1 Tax=Fusarium longipes TaxID=694270 RepID=A0A395SMK0_9HYPO|nr:retinol dehydrogenase 12 [Fusarium longipes]
MSQDSKSNGKGFISRLKRKFRSSTPQLDLRGKTVLVTGTTSGLGLEACRQFLAHGVSQLIMTARTEEKGENVAESLRFRYPDADIQVWALEMESYDSINAFVERALVDLDRLDMVILNAGTLEPKTIMSRQAGHEKMFQVNYVSTALLARLLIPLLRVVPPDDEASRLTIVTTGVYRPNDYFTEPPTFESLSRVNLLQDGNELGLNHLWTRFIQPRMFLKPYISRLASRVNPNEVIINFVVPGLVKNTQLTDKSKGVSWFRRTVRATHALFGKSLKRGAATYIDAVAVKSKSDFYIPPEWIEFENCLWEDTEEEFREIYKHKEGIAATLYKVGSLSPPS